MKVLIIGNGLAGTMAAKSLRELDASVSIEILAEETYPYYPRPNLIEYVAGNLPFERLPAFSADWHERQKIAIRFGTSAAAIDPASCRVTARNGEVIPFDRLLIASGSSAFLPPIPGAEKKNVFVLRTLDDAQAILDGLARGPRVAVLGGGLLGLETARALRMRGAEVSVHEVFDRLLPRQLDERAAELLKGRIEKLGIEIRLKASAEVLLGGESVTGVAFKGGTETPVDMIVIAAGVRPNVALAREAGIAVDQGIEVDDFLRTSHPAVFAAGDAAQHRGRVYGIIPAAFDQARTAAFNILGQEKPYAGTVPLTTLKVAGLAVTSIGRIEAGGSGDEVRVKENDETGVYKKIVLEGGRLAGAIWMGTRKGAMEISRLVTSNKKVESWKEQILEDDFDLSKL